MPATSSVDGARDDWSSGHPTRGTGGHVESQARARGRRRAHSDEPRPRSRRRARKAVPTGNPAAVDNPTGRIAMIGGDEGGAPGRPAARDSLPAVAVTALLTAALMLGAIIPLGPYAILIFVVQALYVFASTTGSAPPAPRIVAGVGLIAAAVVDLAAVLVDHPSLAPLAYVTSAAFGAGVVGQLARPAGRERVTESLASTLAVVIGVTAFSSLVVLIRHPGGTRSIVAGLLAAGVAVVVTRLTDLVAPRPRLAPQVPRGGVGVLLGLVVGTAAGAAGGSAAGVSAGAAAAAGLATALVAVVVDLSVSYAAAGRQLAGEPPAPRPAGLMQGPLAAFALAAPAVYATSALLLLDHV